MRLATPRGRLAWTNENAGWTEDAEAESSLEGGRCRDGADLSEQVGCDWTEMVSWTAGMVWNGVGCERDWSVCDMGLVAKTGLSELAKRRWNRGGGTRPREESDDELRLADTIAQRNHQVPRWGAARFRYQRWTNLSLMARYQSSCDTLEGERSHQHERECVCVNSSGVNAYGCQASDARGTVDLACFP